MNKSLIAGVVVGGIAVTALGSIAGYSYLDKEPQFAEVVASKALYQSVSVPAEQCTDQVVQQRRPVQDQNQIAGTVIGAVVGGVLGNQVGGGSGKKIATVAGAAAGGYAGKQVQTDMQNKDVETSTRRVCKTVQKTEKQLIGYDVTYIMDGKVHKTRLDQEPAERVPVVDGKPDFNSSLSAKS
ncbi:glycine zipper 2TM domain-containing protein [Rheinheimera sp.]|uniref:glycine zipper 2TM domain-containing protein n=1 Tax=Rheinheimera sp. TaxID=1869214 RepID=UPI00307F4C6D